MVWASGESKKCSFVYAEAARLGGSNEEGREGGNHCITKQTPNEATPEPGAKLRQIQIAY